MGLQGRVAGICTGCGSRPGDPPITWGGGGVFCASCVDLFGGADLARQRQKQKREKALKWRSEGLSYRKIGDKLGISLQAAAQLIKRAGG